MMLHTTKPYTGDTPKLFVALRHRGDTGSVELPALYYIGHRIAGSREEALKLFSSSHEGEIVIVDINEMDGFDITVTKKKVGAVTVQHKDNAVV